jgi:hypothetical protein
MAANGTGGARHAQPPPDGTGGQNVPPLSPETRDLLNHLEWADAVVWTAVLALEAAPPTRLRELLFHGHATQWLLSSGGRSR